MQDSEIIEGLLRKTLAHLKKHLSDSPTMSVWLYDPDGYCGISPFKRQVEAVPPAEFASLVTPTIVDVCSVRA